MDGSSITWRCHGAGNCVQVGLLPNGNVAIRDSKKPEFGYQEYTPAEWESFANGVKLGLFDLAALAV